MKKMLFWLLASLCLLLLPLCKPINAEAGILQLTNNISEQIYYIYPEMMDDEGRVLWRSEDKIFLHNGDSAQIIADGQNYASNLQLENGRVAWIIYDNNEGNYKIKFFDGNNVKTIASSTDYIWNMQMVGNKLAWIGGDGQGRNIFLYDG